MEFIRMGFELNSNRESACAQRGDGKKTAETSRKRSNICKVYFFIGMQFRFKKIFSIKIYNISFKNTTKKNTFLIFFQFFDDVSKTRISNKV